MVKKFEEYINEGLWSAGMKRVEDGEERKENKIHSNINELKPINIHDKLDYKFADDILVYDNKEVFTEKEFLEIQNNFLENHNKIDYFKSHWYCPHEGDILKMLEQKAIKYLLDSNGNIVISNKRLHVEIKTNGKKFWCNSMMGPQVWYYENGTIIICDPRYLDKKEASILLYK